MDKKFDAALDAAYEKDHNDAWDYWADGDIV